ncbi:DUF2637 domain-containing protein [Dactylosporangium sp. NPDC048998]|uniref:DUF2637 domain-containing protein n=1 Tax=Dactylosporangium sp. NPDC048998 TaxID=3363976 RepID=UPI0037168561
MLAIGGAAGAASFTHVHNVAAAHGQPGWLAWADAIVLELMSIASGLELRRRKRAHASTTFPAAVLVCAVTLSLAAQVVEAEPSPIGWTAAAVPALGFLVMVKVALGYTGPANRTVIVRSIAPSTTTRRTTSAAVTDRSPAVRTVRPAAADRRPGERSTKVARLLPPARHARDQLAAEGRPLTNGDSSTLSQLTAGAAGHERGRVDCRAGLAWRGGRHQAGRAVVEWASGLSAAWRSVV